MGWEPEDPENHFQSLRWCSNGDGCAAPVFGKRLRMTETVLVLGNKRYSSWSLRGYLALKFAGIAFKEEVIPLFQVDTHSRIKAFAEAAPARVPLLVTGGKPVWDTLSIMEYAAEMSERELLWPEDRYARAHARSIVAEMHAGFAALRDYIPMNLSRHDPHTPVPQEVQADIDRICRIWEDCRSAYGEKGPFLFGSLSLADAAYAPVVVRFRSRSIPVSPVCQTYMDEVWELPAFAEWRQDADKESWVIDQ